MARTKAKAPDPQLEYHLTKLGLHAKGLRESKSLSQQEAIKLSGLSLSGLRDIEQGYETKIGQHILNAAALGVQFGYGVSTDANAELKGLILELAKRLDQMEEHMHLTRRQFSALGSLNLLSFAIPEPLRAFFTEPGFPPLSEDDVAQMIAYCEDLDTQHRALGGGAVLQLTSDMHDRAMTWFLDGRYPSKVKRSLSVLCAQLKSWVGWFAFDAEQFGTATQYLNEAVVFSRIAGSSDVEIHALDNLCALQTHQGYYEQALYTTDAALGACAAKAHRTRAVFFMRAATLNAKQGNEGGLRTAASAAQAELDHGPGEAAPAWNDWADEGGLKRVIGYGYVDLGEGSKAESHLRLSSSNYVGAQLQSDLHLALALVQQGNVADATDQALNILPDVVGFKSARLQRKLRELYDVMNGMRESSRAQDFVAAYNDARAL